MMPAMTGENLSSRGAAEREEPRGLVLLQLLADVVHERVLHRVAEARDRERAREPLLPARAEVDFGGGLEQVRAGKKSAMSARDAMIAQRPITLSRIGISRPRNFMASSRRGPRRGRRRRPGGPRRRRAPALAGAGAAGIAEEVLPFVHDVHRIPYSVLNT
jgi:hypothetical protein